MSLKLKLLNKLKSQSYTTLQELYKIGENHKQSYVERELRRIVEDNKDVKPHKHSKGYILGYLSRARNTPVSDLNTDKVQSTLMELPPIKTPRKPHQDYEC